MESVDEYLTGGNVSETVIRIGATVRKPATPATSSIELLLAHLDSAGFNGSPRSLGRDAQGRHVLEYVPGLPCSLGTPLELPDLNRVGEMIREFHAASSSFSAPPSATWNLLMPSGAGDLICHNDLAPWNLIRSQDRWVFVDWDSAAPGTRLWDLSFAALTFPPIEPNCDLREAAVRIGAVCDGYGLDRPKRRGLLPLMVRRARAMDDLLVAGGRTGEQPWARLYSEGHAEYWGPAADYIEQNLPSLSECLL